MARRTLSPETKEGILRDLAAGVSPAVVAKTWGISIPSAYNYRNRAAASKTVVTTTTGENVDNIGVGTPNVELVTTTPVVATTRKATKRSVR